MGDPQNGWFIREHPIKMDDNWGYPYFRKPPQRIVWSDWWQITSPGRILFGSLVD